MRTRTDRGRPFACEGSAGRWGLGVGRLDFTGSFTLLVTPFGPGGGIDWTGYDRLVAYHRASGGQGIFAVCGTAEMQALALDERVRLAEVAAAGAAGLPVVATGNLEPDLDAQVDEVRRISRTGVAGVVLVPPGRRPDDEGLYAWFARLAYASAVPALLYEWPGRQPKGIPAAVYGRLVRQCGVVGIKDTTCTHAGIAAKLEAAPEGIVYQANHPLLVAAMEAGARGTMTITSAVRPDLLGALWSAHHSGDAARRAALAREVVFLDAVLAQGHPRGAKWLLHRAGVLGHAGCRAGGPPDDAQRAALEAWVQGAPRWCGPHTPPGLGWDG